jgi:steroid delta-isomerase-like uncharacterized protein
VLERAFNHGDFSTLDGTFTPDALFHDPGLEMRGTSELKVGLTMLRQAFPDFHFTVEDTLADADRVAVRYRGQGTQHGEFKGIPATGRRIDYSGMLMVRFEAERIAEFWAQPDLLGVMQQLGAHLVLPTNVPIVTSL